MGQRQHKKLARERREKIKEDAKVIRKDIRRILIKDILKPRPKYIPLWIWKRLVRLVLNQQ